MKPNSFILLTFACLLAGCAKKYSDASARREIAVLNCWYVEDNGAGKHGYAAADAHFNYVAPDGCGLFKTPADLVKGLNLKRDHIKIADPHFEGVIPEGWKIRDLDSNEINLVLGRKK